MSKDMEIFYKKTLKKILNFKASELSTVEFEQVKRNAENWKGVELMKTQEEIYQKIRELENDIIEFKNIIENSKDWAEKSDYETLIFEVEKKISLLKWVLEG